MKKLLLFSALLIFACSTDSEGNPCIYEPTLTTQAATDITETSATLNGVISILSENCEVPNNTEQGFVYSTEIQPTLEDTQVNVNGTNISTTIEGLEPNTTYYVRSFLTNTLGEFYGDEISFSTEELDLTPPVITIIGDNPLEINIGEDYTEFGATATDDIDGDITQDIIIDYSNLNTTLAGSYTVTYSVSDLSNNSTSEQREVIVIDNSNIDNDGDGYSENQGDCDDNNVQVYTGAEEICDGLDNDCDGNIDEDFGDECYLQVQLNSGATPLELYNENNNYLDLLYGLTYRGGIIYSINLNNGEVKVFSDCIGQYTYSSYYSYYGTNAFNCYGVSGWNTAYSEDIVSICFNVYQTNRYNFPDNLGVDTFGLWTIDDYPYSQTEGWCVYFTSDGFPNPNSIACDQFPNPNINQQYYGIMIKTIEP